MLWYRRMPAVPGNRRQSGCLLHIGARDQRAKIFCNGQYVFEHGRLHGLFCRPHGLLRPGDNELIVQVKDDLEASQLSRGKQSSKRGGIWYTPQSGIWQTVWCEWVLITTSRGSSGTHLTSLRTRLHQVQASSSPGPGPSSGSRCMGKPL
ncbi:MAG: hypothetical protein ACLR8U_09480 [Oscillospiraceae bacterium]